jgi:hypothetical protein
MARPTLPLGTWGKIRRYQLGPKSWRATANYRDYDGVTRRVERSGGTAAKAERVLIEDLRDRARVNGQGEITADTPLREVAAAWFEAFKLQGKASSTVDATTTRCGCMCCLRLVPCGFGS